MSFREFVEDNYEMITFGCVILVLAVSLFYAIEFKINPFTFERLCGC